MEGLQVKRTPTRIILWVVLVVTVLLYAFPFLYMLLTSFKAPLETIAVPPRILPSHWTIENYTTALSREGVLASFVNGAMTAVLSTAVSLVLAVPAAYAVTRFRTRYGRIFIVLALVMRMVPPIAVGVPMVQIFQSIGLYDTTFALALAHVTISLPLSVWLMSSFFKSVPVELEEAAKIDGCTHWGVFLRIILPLSLPSVSAISLVAFVTGWGDYLFASTMLKRAALWTLPMGLTSFRGEFFIQWAEIMAMSTIVTVPIVALFIYLQRYLVDLMAGGVKG